MNNVTLMIGKGTTFWDISKLAQKITWGGRRTSAPRSLDLLVTDSEQLLERVPANCVEGQTVTFSENGKELFQGLLMREERRGQSRTLTLKCYDVCVRFTNNKDSFSYRQFRADQIFVDCCNRLGLAIGSVANTEHVIGELVKSATTYWDVIEDSLSQTFKATGTRYYVQADKGKVNLIKRINQANMPIFELKTNVSNYTHNRSIENTRTRLKMVTQGGQLKSYTTVPALEANIGQFQDVETVDSKITDTEVTQRITVFETEKGIADESLKIWALGDSTVKSGGCVFANLPNIDTKRIMYVEEDTHVWEKGGHTMTVTLDYAKTAASITNLYAVKDESSSSGSGSSSGGGSSSSDESIYIKTKKARDYEVGSEVQFKGGYTTESSAGGKISNKNAEAGTAQVLKVDAHNNTVLIATKDPKSTTVFGWVPVDELA